MSRPKKSEIRAWMKRVRADLTGLNQALTNDNAQWIKTYVNDLLNSTDEIAGLSEERYGIVCQGAIDPARGMAAEAGPGEEDDEGMEDDEDAEEGDEDYEYEEDEDAAG